MRNKRLDILRCLAIMLVVNSHSHLTYFATRTGWFGVDLFFVLSGFLISGLLYSEYKKRQDISFRRFFLRRGLKIYPAFYVLILVTFIAQHLLWHGAPAPLTSFLSEVLFVQNYHYGVWAHTWSLAVEEHFYIGLALLLLVLGKVSSDRSNPFRSIPWIFAGVAVVCLALRALTIWVFPPAENLTAHVTNPTHARIDGLFFGVLIGYFYHFRPEAVQRVLRLAGNRWLIGILSALLLSTCYFFAREDHFLLSFGLPFLYLGYGGLLVLTLATRGLLQGVVARVAEKIGTRCAYIGRHSYSIYLWHGPLLVNYPVFERKILHVETPFALRMVIYVAGSYALGILFAHLIEFPVLRFRDRFFLTLQQPTVVPALAHTQVEPEKAAASVA